MGRKSKHAGSGHLPMTNYERKIYSTPYGTTTARLGGSSQYTFGHCALTLHAAKDQPVATPSGYIYERSAMLEYLLAQTQKLKQQEQRYEQWVEQQEHEKTAQEETKRKAQVEEFENAQKVVKRQKKTSNNANDFKNSTNSAVAASSGAAAAVEDNPLKRTSYWLSEFQPETDQKADFNEMMQQPPPKRPPSPMSQQPLRSKDLIELDLKFNSSGQVVCAISEKSIVHQQALALISKNQTKAQVVLEKVYNDLGSERTCPVTGKKLTKILKLQKGGSSFAANGGVIEAKTYRPSMT